MASDQTHSLSFHELGLSRKILKSLDGVGYKIPTAIQAQTIPVMLKGRDLVGQAQTGTGKTAAFALPILDLLDLSIRQTQVLVLVPTRELAIQVAESFQRYANKMSGFHVLPVYGGQEYGVQLRALRRGLHVVVGTPGRIMDHVRRKTLRLNTLRFLVLDEADEMLRMGFIEDIEWIFSKTPDSRQTSLFSATIPTPIRKIAERYLKTPAEVSVRLKTTTASTIRQRYWLVEGLNKIDGLTRLLETENFEGVLIFVRTKTATVDLSERLQARGYSSNAINGDMPQKSREQTIDRLRNSKLDVLVATDVAARGLDVDCVSHVINFDVPHDPERYVHRVGRTGRAGRHGEAIMFVMPRERHMLRLIEKVTRQPIERMELPSTEMLNHNRRNRFMQGITDTVAGGGLSHFQELVEHYHAQTDTDPLVIAAALAKLLQGDEPLLFESSVQRSKGKGSKRGSFVSPHFSTHGVRQRSVGVRRSAQTANSKSAAKSESAMQRYRIEIGHMHNVQQSKIVAVLAKEAGLEVSSVGRIKIKGSYSLIDLPAGMPMEIFNHLKEVRLAGQRIGISAANDAAGSPPHKKREDRDKRAPSKPHKKERHRDRKTKGAKKKR